MNKIKGCSREDAAGLFEILADILLITGSRASCKAYFPFSFYYATLSVADLTILKARNMNPDGVTWNCQPVVIQGIADYDHSGKGAYVFWNRVADLSKFQMQIGTDVRRASEIVFHAVWGTHWEDLNALLFATDHHFLTRRELGDAFKEKGSKGVLKEITLIKFKKYAKLSQALPTEFNAGGQQQVWSKTVISGKRKLHVGDAFAQYLKRTKIQTSQLQSSTNLYNHLSNYKSSLYKKVMDQGHINVGVVNWMDAGSATYDKDGAVVDGPPGGVPRLFMGDGSDAADALQDEDL